MDVSALLGLLLGWVIGSVVGYGIACWLIALTGRR
jgi:hypothetical protein